MSNGTKHHLWRLDNARKTRTPPQSKPAGYMALEDGPTVDLVPSPEFMAEHCPLGGLTLSFPWELWRDNSSEYTEAMPFDRPGSYVRIDGLGTSFAWSIWLEGMPVATGIGSRADAIAAAVELGAVVE